MPVYPEKLVAELKRGLKPIYFVAGDEPLIVEEALDSIRAAARAQGFDERECFTVDRGFDWNQLSDATANGSLFCSRRIVECNLGDASPGTVGGRAIRELAEQAVPDVLILLRGGRVDARSRSSAWIKAVEAKGCFIYAWPLRAEQFPRWLRERLAAAGLNVDEDALRLLVQRTEGNLLAAAQDIEKLRLLCSGNVGLEQVREAVADSARFDVFEWVDRVLMGDAAGAVRGLRRLREEAVEPVLIGWALSRELRSWAQAAAQIQAGASADMAMKSLYIPRPRQAAYEKALRRADARRVLSWLRRSDQVDVLVKSGQAQRAWEELLTCTLAASGAAQRIQA